MHRSAGLGPGLCSVGPALPAGTAAMHPGLPVP